ncbi:MAG: hypothetical protein ACTSUO_01125 [Candidatus Thorarchaeota archaeon]
MSPKKILSIDDGLGDKLISSEIIHSFPISAIVVDQSNVYSTASDGTLIAWEKETLSHLQTVQVSKQDLPALSMDSDFLFTGSVYDDPIIRVWDKKDLDLVSELEGHTSSILSLFSTEDYLYSGSADGSVIIWRKSDWVKHSSIDSGHQIVLSLDVDADYIYVGGINNCTNVFRKSDNTLLTSLEGHNANVFSLATDEKFVYSGSGEIWWGGPGSPRPPSFESAIRVWDKTTWECIAILSGHSDNVNALAVDDSLIYSVSDDGTLRVNVKSNWSEGEVINPGIGVINALASDSDDIYIGGADNKVTKISKLALLQARRF